MSKDESDRNALAATWLELRIRALIKETEREFGVYIFHERLTTVDVFNYVSVELEAHVWPESMRIIEPERESKAIG